MLEENRSEKRWPISRGGDAPRGAATCAARSSGSAASGRCRVDFHDLQASASVGRVWNTGGWLSTTVEPFETPGPAWASRLIGDRLPEGQLSPSVTCILDHASLFPAVPWRAAKCATRSV